MTVVSKPPVAIEGLSVIESNARKYADVNKEVKKYKYAQLVCGSWGRIIFVCARG